MQEPQDSAKKLRELPKSIVIPPIRGEMALLRPATLDDLHNMDELGAFEHSSLITGKDESAESSMVHAWVERSLAWSQGSLPITADAQLRPTMAWAIVPDNRQASDPAIIGMIFLIDIDGWSSSARIQVVLGKDYRGRGYSRDAMPRVMTYAFATEPTGLGLHRIWVGVPSTNTRALSVYQSLGFVRTGVSRDALWDESQQKYQDFVVLDTLGDEYDAIRSLDAFGLHVIEDNPGVREAMSAHEHSIALPIQVSDKLHEVNETAKESSNKEFSKLEHRSQEDAQESQELRKPSRKMRKMKAQDSQNDVDWPYNTGSTRKASSKRAWWRIIGRGRKQQSEGKR